MKKTYSVYILASRSRALYTGVTGNLQKRMIEHRQGLIRGFTTRYRVFRLVHLENFADVREAIAREKEIKGWRREKKIRLIERDNSTWQDLAAQLPHAYPSEQAQSRSLNPSPDTSERIRDDKSHGHASTITHTLSPMSFRTK
jgi:putative endonuclease